jgi:hypothetical protein
MSRATPKKFLCFGPGTRSCVGWSGFAQAQLIGPDPSSAPRTSAAIPKVYPFASMNFRVELLLIDYCYAIEDLTNIEYLLNSMTPLDTRGLLLWA